MEFAMIKCYSLTNHGSFQMNKQEILGNPLKENLKIFKIQDPQLFLKLSLETFY